MNHHSKKLTSFALGTLAIATTLSIITGCNGPKSKFATEQYKFYPQNTNYFVELTPSEGDIKNFGAAIEKLEAASGQGQQFSQFNLIEKYNKSFEPKITFGAWYANAKGEVAEASHPHVLASVGVKKDITLESLQKDATLPAGGQFKTIETKKGAIKAYSVTSNGNEKASTFALYNNVLFVSEIDTDIIQAVDQESSNGKSIADNELVMKAVGLIPAKREGTFVSSQSP